MEIAQFANDALIMISCRKDTIVYNRLQFYSNKHKDWGSIWHVRKTKIKVQR